MGRGNDRQRLGLAVAEDGVAGVIEGKYTVSYN